MDNYSKLFTTTTKVITQNQIRIAKVANGGDISNGKIKFNYIQRTMILGWKTAYNNTVI